jgi:hypothetical protein
MLQPIERRLARESCSAAALRDQKPGEGTQLSMGVELSSNVGFQISLGDRVGVGWGISRYWDRRFSFQVVDRAALAVVAG